MAVFENLQELIDLLGDAPDVAELTLSRPGGEQIMIKRSPRAASGGSLAPVLPAQSAERAPIAASETPAASLTSLSGSAAASGVLLATEVLANRVGIFHPAKPSVETGGHIAAGQIVGYIEAIKLMNEVRAASSGTVAEQFVEDGMPVEYGQPLFRLAAL